MSHLPIQSNFSLFDGDHSVQDASPMKINAYEEPTLSPTTASISDMDKEYEIFGFNSHGLLMPMVLFGWFLAVAFAKVFHEFILECEKTPNIIKRFPESCLLILLGLTMGFILPKESCTSMAALFTNHNFFIYILPPIIFEAGYTVPMRPFTNNAVEILIYAILGTFLNTILVGLCMYGFGQVIDFGFPPESMDSLRYLLYAAIISAVDPVAVLAVFDQIHVNTTLYILVFGESLMNDGVAVVLYNVFEQLLTLVMANGDLDFDLMLVLKLLAHFTYIVLGGILIGSILGLSTAYLTKFTHYSTMMEPIVVFGFAYISYVVAEACKTSAILALVFCAFTMRFYVHHNIHKESDTSIHNTGGMLAYLTEATIFLNLGLVGAGILREYFLTSLKFFGVSLFMCLAMRFMIVFTLTYFINKFYRQNEIKLKDQLIMAYGGLRGGIAFSLMQVATLGCQNSHDDGHGSSTEQHGSSGVHDASVVVHHDNVDGITLRQMVDPCDPDHLKDTKGILLCSTLLLVLFTCFVQGSTISYIVDWLHVEKEEQDRNRSYFEESAREIITEVMMGVRGIVSSHHGRQYFWFKFDQIKHKHLNDIFERNPEHKSYFEKKIKREFEEVQHEEMENLHKKVDQWHNLRRSMSAQGKKDVNLDNLTLDQLERLPEDLDTEQLNSKLTEIFTAASKKRRQIDSVSSSHYNTTYDGRGLSAQPKSRASQLWVKSLSNVIQKDQSYHDQ